MKSANQHSHLCSKSSIIISKIYLVIAWNNQCTSILNALNAHYKMKRNLYVSRCMLLQFAKNSVKHKICFKHETLLRCIITWLITKMLISNFVTLTSCEFIWHIYHISWAYHSCGVYHDIIGVLKRHRAICCTLPRFIKGYFTWIITVIFSSA